MRPRNPAVRQHYLAFEVRDAYYAKVSKGGRDERDANKILKEEAERAQLNILSAIYGTRRACSTPLADIGHVLRVLFALLVGLVAAFAAAIPLNTCPSVIAVRGSS